MELWELWAMMWMWKWEISYKPWNQKIKTVKINLPKIYQIVARKENTWVANITILWISLLDDSI